MGNIINFNQDVTINEINLFVEGYYKKWLNDKNLIQNLLIFEFEEDVKIIDELFYAYLLLLKQSFPKVEITLNITSNDPKQIAKQHIVYLNAYYQQPFISIEGEDHLHIKNTKSADFIPHILVKANDKKEPVGFEDSKSEKLKQLLTIKKFNIKSIIKSAQKEYDEQNKKKKTKEIILAEKLKFAITEVESRVLNHFYRIEVLSYLGVLEDYLTEKPNDILSLLTQNKFFTFSQIKLYFFYILIIQLDKAELKKEYKNILPHLFAKTNKIYFGLKELAQNIIDHTENGVGVISARVHKTDKIDKLKNFGGNFNEWFNQYGKDKDISCFLDINVIDAGKIGVTQKYIEKIEVQIEKYKNKTKEEKDLETKVRECLEEDKKTIEEKKHGFSHFINYERIELSHQIQRINSRIGLLLFSKTVCKDEKGIVKASSIKEEGNSECVYFYEKSKKSDNNLITSQTNNDKENLIQLETNYNLVTSQTNGDKDNFVQLGTNYNFILPIHKKAKKTQRSTQTPNEQGTASSVLSKLFEYEIVDILKDISNEKSESSSNEKSESGSNLKVEQGKYKKIFSCADKIKTKIKTFNENKKEIALIDVEKLKIEDFNSSDWIRLLASISFDNKTPIIFINIKKEFYQEIIDFNSVFQTNFWKLSPVLFYIKQYFPKNLQPKDKDKELFLWFSNVLAGDTYYEYMALNRNINNYQHNLYDIQEFDDEEEEKIKQTTVKATPSILFDDKNLLNFELLIKGKDNLTLFEQSIESLMNLEIRTLPDKYLINNSNITREERFFYKYKGYKISNSHFRLGSKLHISDYYYAKRIFYNSFYANRFAFLTTKYLLNTDEKEGFGKWQKEVMENGKKKMTNIDATLIGYSRYSELLVSNIKRLLELQGFGNINHDMMLETDSTLKNPEDIKDKVIIIVPIASTFSTSLKIKKNLK
ncbi:MAG: hypothetical protein LBQ13_03545, partial [Endomicrobium sp.]|nr:hypothetical protein [Endomicrobium sp.]